jgi:hypothetical protein
MYGAGVADADARFRLIPATSRTRRRPAAVVMVE